jgi:DNA-binding response OmpR family regulator
MTRGEDLMPTALIVEDEPEANQLLSMLVQLRGYQTDSAFTGGEALEMVGRVRPDIVFLDLMLPDINGYDVCRALKASRPTCAIPVVMVTARLASENRVQGFRVGATDYVSKPYTPDQIFGAMARADDWRRRLEEGKDQGVIPLDARGDVAPLREISRLRTLLLERTRLSEEAARRLDQVLLDLATRAVEWGSRNGIGLVATLHYHWENEVLVLTLRDESGWFDADSPRRPEGLGGLIARGRFAEVNCCEGEHQVVFTSLLHPAR